MWCGAVVVSGTREGWGDECKTGGRGFGLGLDRMRQEKNAT